ncbi:MAG: beta-N-acetylhexosaminidase [Bacilli bacterium]
MKKLCDMTLKEKLGQLIMAGFEDDYYDEHARKIIEEYKIANIILFSRNIKDINQLIKLNKKIYQEVMNSTGTIPFISIDQEGGMVTRIKSGATFCPGNMSIASTGNSDNAEKIGRISGDELAHLGINMNLAPSLDVNNNPNNPVIGVRSYGDNPNKVAEYGNKYIKGLQEAGVIATAKHFPGHGDTEVDSHLGLATVNYDKSRLNSLELVPFKSAIKNGVKAIMSAHIIFKALDDVPATLSDKILNKYLREELGFKGLIVSDCMQMKAIDNIYTTERGVVMGIKNGLDIACVSHSLDKQIESLRLLELAVKSGDIKEEIIDEKVQRVLDYKAECFDSMNQKFLLPSYTENVEYFKNIKQHKIIAQEVIDDSLCLLSGHAFKAGGKVKLLGTIPFAKTIVEENVDTQNIVELVKQEIPNISTMQIAIDPDNTDDIVRECAGFDKVILVTYNARDNKKQIELAKRLSDAELYVIETRNPYSYSDMKWVQNYACLAEYSPISIKTIVKYLKGEIVPKGHLPIELEKSVTIGASVYLGLKEYTIEDNIEYLKKLKKVGINYVFISAQMGPLTDEFLMQLKKVLTFAKKNDMNIALDVNKVRLEELEKLDLIKDVSTLRLDYGFKKEEILAFQDKPYYIQLNASTNSQEVIEYLISHNANMSKYSMSHNFYPKPYTGLSIEKVQMLNKYYHENNLKVLTYIPSSNMKRPPLFKGLPTIERQRNGDVLANLTENYLLGSDVICFGDSYASDEEMEEAVNFRPTPLPLPISLFTGISSNSRNQLMRLHQNRGDAGEYMVRSSLRCKGIEPYNNCLIHKGDITIDNCGMGRYEGEIGIALIDMPMSKNVNVIGHVLGNDFLINSIKAGQKFKFIIKEEKKC